MTVTKLFPVLWLFAWSLSSFGTGGPSTASLNVSSATSDVSIHVRIEEILTLDTVPDSPVGTELFKEISQLSRLLVQLDEPAKAIELATKSVQLFPGEMRSACLAGWVGGMVGDVTSAVNTLLDAKDLPSRLLQDPDGRERAACLTNLGGFLNQLGRFKEAVPFLEEARKADRESALPDYLIGEAYFHLKDAYLCSRAFEKAFAKDPRPASPQDYLLYAWALDQMKKLDKAEQVIESAIESFPSTPGLFFNLAMNKESQSATREAYYAYQLEKLVADEASPYFGEAQKRIERIERIQRATPYPDPELLAVIDHLTPKENSEEEVVDLELKKAVDLNGLSHPFIIHLEAQRLLDTEDYSAAIVLLEKGVQENPSQLVLRLDLARVYGKAGERDKASSLIQSLLLISPDHPGLRQLIGPSGALSAQSLE